MGSAILGLAIVYAVQTLLLVASQPCQVGPGGPQLWGYDVVTELPHDARAYTQGLQHDVICDAQNSCSEVFWESTGAAGSWMLLQAPPLLKVSNAPTALQMHNVNRHDMFHRASVCGVSTHSSKTFGHGSCNSLECCHKNPVSHVRPLHGVP
jgi:hypothetical protein